MLKYIHSLIFLFFFFIVFSLYAQNDAFTNEVVHKGDKVFFNNKPLSGWLFSEEDGIPNDCDCILKAKYLNGLLNGSKKEWYASGKPKLAAIYKHGILVNKKSYYKNGKLKKEEKYDNGTVIQSVLYNRDGSIKGNTHKQFENTNNSTYLSVPQPNTNNISENQQENGYGVTQNILNYNSIYKEGLIKTTYPNGKNKRVSLYKANLIVKDSLFFETGFLHTCKKYLDGELVHSEEYNNNKKLIKENNFLNNKKNGKQQENYDDGTPKLIEIYDNGSLIHKEGFLKNGFTLYEENYKFNKKDNLQKKYDELGKVKEIQKYNLGRLEKTERFIKEGKEVVIIKNKLEEIKTFNTNDQLISHRFRNTITKSKDSIELHYNPNNGNKTQEYAYKNGKITREGKYKNNKKEGYWHFFYIDGAGEKSELYNNGNLIDSDEIIYAHQIKNSYKTEDYLFSYQTPGHKVKNEYILLKFDENENKKEAFQRIKNTNVEVLGNKFLQIKDTIGLSNLQLSFKIKCLDVNYRLKPKENNPKKYIVYIKENLEVHQLEDNSVTKKDFISTPVNKKNTNISNLYTKDKVKAFKQTQSNLKNKITAFIETIFPEKVVLYRALSQSKTEIKKVKLYALKKSRILEKDIFILRDDNGEIKVKFIVTSVSGGIILSKVEEGGKWLFNYLQNNKNPILEKSVKK